jgi:hypothetical protein
LVVQKTQYPDPLLANESVGESEAVFSCCTCEVKCFFVALQHARPAGA